jgi:hypothetical protein
MIESHAWGTFEPINHIYRNTGRLWKPSSTQIIKLAGLSPDLSMVEEEYLDWKSALGTRVHYLTDVYDMNGRVDPAELTMDDDGYVESYIAWRRMSGFVPKRVSFRHIAKVNGYEYGMELDKEGFLGKYPAIADLKCSMMNPAAWGYQTASYEMGVYGSPRCGRVIRFALRLFKDGKPGQMLHHENHENDAMQFLSALVNVHERIRLGFVREPRIV